MQLLAVNLARVLLFIESVGLNPRGKAYYPDIVKALVEKCGFYKYPEKLEDFDQQRGVEFAGGRWGDSTVESFKIYNNGLLLDTRVSTSESEHVLLEVLAWATDRFGIVYDPTIPRRKAFLSQIIVQTEVPILGRPSSPIGRLAQRSKETMGRISGDGFIWESTVLTINSEQVPRKALHAPFTIQRRVDTPFSENKYFSESPFPTEIHLNLLQQLEADTLAL